MNERKEHSVPMKIYSRVKLNEDEVNVEVKKSSSEHELNSSATGTNNDLLYYVNDIPPWYMCILCAFQDYLLGISSIVAVPLVLAPRLCIGDDELGNVAKANIICSLFMVSGICTLLQTTLGIRLPIMQGASFAFLPPTLAILALPHNQCPDPLPQGFLNSTKTLYNDTDGQIVDGDELWQRRVTEIQGAIIAASLVEILLGLTGAIGFMMRFIGPLTIVPTISLIGLDLFSVASRNAQGQWGIAIGTIAILVVSSQYLSGVMVPVPAYNKTNKFHVTRFPIFKVFPVLIALVCSWLLCFILTITNAIPNDPNNANYLARTDIRSDVIHNSPWFRFPYPGQWGLPKVTVAGFVGMIGGVISSIIESLGDYYACARLTGAPSPPSHAVNRGIMMEGVGVMLAGLVGTTSGTTSYSQNIAAIGITRVGSRRVMQVTGLLLILLGLIGKVASIFVTIPYPIIGGICCVLFGVITAVGLTNLKFVDLDSNRNIFIIGFSLFMGLSVANWMKQNEGAIQTGVYLLDEVFTVVLSSSIIVGGGLGMFFDNTLPGSTEERGMEAWRREKTKINSTELSSSENLSKSFYDLPFSTSCCRLSKFIPVLPQYKNAVESDSSLPS